VCDDGNVLSGDGCSGNCLSDETCGNGYLDPPAPMFAFPGEQCDDGNNMNGDGCQGNCKVPFCGDGITDANLFEECDDGVGNSDTKDACRTTCRRPRCGDNVKDTGENCDNGNTTSGDGCSADCLSDETCGNGYVDPAANEACDPAAPQPGACRLDCTIPGCGDGVLDVANGEGCDDGVLNSNAADAACRLNCQPRRCGDGIQDAGEVCDDGDIIGGDGCSADCKSDETCGNGYVDIAADEACDPAAPNPGACRADCTIPGCGDDILDLANGEACDNGIFNSNDPDAGCRLNCQPKRCGDNIDDTGEVCDDGNIVGNDGCSADCLSDEVCGNGYVDVATGEACDPGAPNAGTCRADCTIPRCGDGIVDANNGEGCDDGDGVNSEDPDASCRTNCQPRRCGDGVVDPGDGEVCDDSNVLPGDGCRGDCRSDETCGNGELDTVMGEQCDDQNPRGLGQDGCSSTCQVEIPLWTNITPSPPDGCNDCSAAFDSAHHQMIVFGGFAGVINQPLDSTRIWDGSGWSVPRVIGPSARGGYAVAYDSARDRVVMFGGGADAFTGKNETWEWDGSTWTLKSPTTKPPARTMTRAVYDSVRGKIVLFGGYNGAVLNDLWEYDGSNWTKITATSPPTARQRHAMAFDAAHGTIIVTGGWDATNTNLADTWVYDPTTTTWTQSASAVSARHDANMAYDSVRQRVVLFGGHLGSVTAFNDTYEWDGTSWTAKSPTTKPTGRADHAMTYDTNRQRIVLYAGRVSQNGSVLTDVWEWDGTNWAERVPKMSPDARSNAAMAYDAARGRLVMFGGEDTAGTTFSDTWEFDGKYWTKMSPATVPAGRTLHTMTYDATRKQIVMFGGVHFCCTPQLDELWTWDGTNWTQIPKAGAWPSARYGAALVSDDARGDLILYGGFDSNNTYTTTTWKWNGSVWTQLFPATTPQGMTGHGTYDAARQRIIVQGGIGAATIFTYEWTGTNWQFVSSNTPSAVDGAFAYNPARGSSLYFGGTLNNADIDETWEWNGGFWNQLLPPVAPTGREASAIAYDALHGEIVMFGGVPTNDETWAFAFSSTGSPPEACIDAAEDSDGDGLAGCADPDCWARCTPFCPPRTSCSDLQPQCGDDTCSAVEDAAICPDDCP
jgi:cysteine-rich repeat protein